jgi:hypothetical protein
MPRLSNDAPPIIYIAVANNKRHTILSYKTICISLYP